jgi:hypothetical protein
MIHRNAACANLPKERELCYSCLLYRILLSSILFALQVSLLNVHFLNIYVSLLFSAHQSFEMFDFILTTLLRKDINWCEALNCSYLLAFEKVSLVFGNRKKVQNDFSVLLCDSGVILVSVLKFDKH